MSPIPSGKVIPTPVGRDLVIVRTFRAPIEDVWASITEPERTARWFGTWSGESGEGRTIRYTLTFEAGAEPAEMTIAACEPPRHLALRAENEYGSWHLEAHLTEVEGVTELRFTQHLDAKANVGDVGPGWEYYLDNLVASRSGGPVPDFNDYYPAQTEYYLALERRIAPSQ
jgi:uncharacterized protein YndB with AHSA1/START domain